MKVLHALLGVFLCVSVATPALGGSEGPGGPDNICGVGTAYMKRIRSKAIAARQDGKLSAASAGLNELALQAVEADGSLSAWREGVDSYTEGRCIGAIRKLEMVEAALDEAILFCSTRACD